MHFGIQDDDKEPPRGGVTKNLLLKDNSLEVSFSGQEARKNAMGDLQINLSVPFPTVREAEIAYQVLRVDKEPPRGGVTKNLSLKDNSLEVSFSGQEARKVRVGLTSFFESLLLVTETILQFGPSEPV